MWRVTDLTPLQATIAAADEFVSDFLNRAWEVYNPAGIVPAVQAQVAATAGRLGKVLTPDLADFLLRFALNPFLKEIIADYTNITRSYQDHLGRSAPIGWIDCPHTRRLMYDTSTYFYYTLLDEPAFRSEYLQYNGTASFRSRYRAAFLQSGYRVCPYCDNSKLTYEPRCQIDHFLPRVHFPMLGLHWYNLVPACSTCNGFAVKGKKLVGTLPRRNVNGRRQPARSNHVPVAHPFFDDPNAVLLFKFNTLLTKLRVTTRPGASAVEAEKVRNFAKLFDLENNYDKELDRLDSERMDIRDVVQTAYRREAAAGNQGIAVLQDCFKKQVRERLTRRAKQQRREPLCKLYGDLYEFLLTDQFRGEIKYLADLVGL